MSSSNRTDREKSTGSTNRHMQRGKWSKEQQVENSHRALNKISKGEQLTLIGSYEWRGLTDKDIDLRESYAKDLIVNISRVDPKFLALERLTSSLSASALSETYKVHLGVREWGIVSIRTQNMLGKYNMLIVVQRSKKGPKKKWSKT